MVGRVGGAAKEGGRAATSRQRACVPVGPCLGISAVLLWAGRAFGPSGLKNPRPLLAAMVLGPSWRKTKLAPRRADTGSGTLSGSIQAPRVMEHAGLARSTPRGPDRVCRRQRHQPFR